jgi:uncharacterized protein YllA (UPF0747 family)
MNDGDMRYQINTDLLCPTCYKERMEKIAGDIQVGMEEALKRQRAANKLKATRDMKELLKEQEEQIRELQKKLEEKEAIIQDEIKLATRKWEKVLG